MKSCRWRGMDVTRSSLGRCTSKQRSSWGCWAVVATKVLLMHLPIASPSLQFLATSSPDPAHPEEIC